MAIGKLHNFFQASPVKPLGNVVRNSPIRMKPKPIGFEFAEIDARKILKPSSHDKYIHEPEFDSVVYINRFAEAIFRLLSQYFFRLPRLKWDPGIFKVFVHYLSKLLGPLGYLAPIFLFGCALDLSATNLLQCWAVKVAQRSAKFCPSIYKL